MIKQLLLICLVTDNLDQYLEFQFRLSIYCISYISPPGIGGLGFPVVLDWGLIRRRGGGGGGGGAGLNRRGGLNKLSRSYYNV